jgi:hypothetical protein
MKFLKYATEWMFGGTWAEAKTTVDEGKYCWGAGGSIDGSN